MDTLAEQTKVGPRVVFHAINQIGLGHLSRLSAIALALRDRAPQVSTIILVDGSSHGLLEAVQLPYVGVSFSPTREGPGAFPDEPRSLLRQGFADHILSVLRPALLVFDSFPDPEFLRAARRRKISLALCLRKMRAPQFKRIHRMMGVFDTILLPHDRGEIEIPDELVPKSHFVGTIVRPLSTSRDDHAPDIVISGGGGGFPGTVQFYNAALSAFTDLRRDNPNLSGLLVTGPLFQDWTQLHPVDGVQILPFDPNLTARFARSRLIVCQAGYNTIAEVTALGVPVVCIPGQRDADDQFERAGLVAGLHPQVQVCAEAQVQAMAAMMVRGLAMNRRRGIQSPRGAEVAAQHLLDALETIEGRS